MHALSHELTLSRPRSETATYTGRIVGVYDDLRIFKIHLKDFMRKGSKWTNLLEGSVNCKQVRLALGEIGYDGFLTPELRGGDQAYLTDLSERIDKIIAM